MINGLPDKLKALRMQHGFSQREVAKQLNVSPSIVSGYETGERTPSVEVLLAISYLYRCSTDYLLGRTGTAPDVVINVEGLSKKQIRAISELVKVIRD